MLRIFFKANMYAVLVIGLFLALLPFGVIKLVGLIPLKSFSGLDKFFFIAGICLVILGGALSYSCMTIFVTKGQGTAFPTDPPRKFVVLGAYKYVRNPMYIGNLVLAFGVGLFLQSATYLIYTFLLAVVTHFYIVFHEEPRLVQRFGQEYIEYYKMTNRWIPKFDIHK